MLWLLRSGLIHHNNRVKKPEIPLSAYQDGAFKAFLNDVGLLAAMCGLNTRVLLEHDRVFGEYQGALTEQYVQQQLLAEGHDDKTYYWARERNEIDFLLTTDQGIVPLEATAGVNLNSKSLHAFCKRFGFKLAVRASMQPTSATRSHPPAANPTTSSSFRSTPFPSSTRNAASPNPHTPGEPAAPSRHHDATGADWCCHWRRGGVYRAV